MYIIKKEGPFCSNFLSLFGGFLYNLSEWKWTDHVDDYINWWLRVWVIVY